MFRKIIVGIFVVIGLIGFIPKSQAIENRGAFVITHFEVDILVKKNAILEVKEVIDVHFFEKRHGVFRNIPVKYKDDRGFEYNMKLAVSGVENGEGEKIEYQISDSGGDKVLKIGDPNLEIIGDQRYVIRYEIEKGMRYFNDHDEIFWNPIGTGWPTEIYNVSSTVKFEDGADFISGSGVCFTGGFGSKNQDCLVEEKSSKEVRFEATKVLNKYEGLTVAVYLPKGAVYEPTRWEYFLLSLADNWGFGIPIMVFIGMFFLWLVKGKEIDLEKTIIAHYEAPNNLTPGEMGYLMKERYSVQFVTADIINLAVKGYLDIYEVENEGVSKWFKKNNYELENKKDWKGAKDLAEHEKELLKGLFSSDKMGKIKLSDKKNSFYKNIDIAKEKVKERLRSEDYFETSLYNKKGIYVAVAVLGGVGMFFLGVILERLDLILGTGSSILILIVFGVLMSKKTSKGAEVYWQIKGYKHYIDIAEKHRSEFNAKENIFEKTLPYAMVFGNINKWAKAFEGIAKKQPSWYHSSSTRSFNSIVFASSVPSGSAGD